MTTIPAPEFDVVAAVDVAWLPPLIEPGNGGDVIAAEDSLAVPAELLLAAVVDGAAVAA
jgi:hypothetical protein